MNKVPEIDEIQDLPDVEWFGGKYEFEERPAENCPRWVGAKRKEKLQRRHVGQATGLLEEFHSDLSSQFMPDRLREVDQQIQTVHGTRRVELKANDTDFTFNHGDPEKNSWSYEHNFTARKADLIIGTSHTGLPEDNTIPVIRTPSPRQLRKLSKRSRVKQETVSRFTALRLEEQLYPLGQRTLMEYVTSSCMENCPPKAVARCVCTPEDLGRLRLSRSSSPLGLHVETFQVSSCWRV